MGPGAVRSASDRRPRRDHPPRAGGPCQIDPGRIGRRRREGVRRPRGVVPRARRAPAVVRLGNVLYGPAERGRDQSRVRPLHRQDRRGPEHQLALANRLGDQGSGLGSADHRGRLSQSRRQRRHPRREPDADRGQEYRRRSLQGELADRPRQARGLRVQHPQPARDGQGGGREHHARGRRPEDHRRHPHHRPRVGRGRCAKADAGPARIRTGPAFS